MLVSRSEALMGGISLFAALMFFVVTFSYHHNSARFDVWDALYAHAGIEEEHYTSLKEMAKSADATVVGRIVDASVGRTLGDSEARGAVTYVNLQLMIEEILTEADDVRALPSRHPAHLLPGKTIVVESMIQDPSDISRINKLLPSDDQILFLRNKGIAAEARGRLEAPGVTIDESLRFYRPVNSQGVFENDSGHVELPLAEPGDTGFHTQFSNTNFAELVEEIDRLKIADE